MIRLSRLKTDLEFTHDLGDIIDVLKTAALVQFNAFQQKEKPDENFFAMAGLCFGELLEYTPAAGYMKATEHLPAAITVITSEEGFLGELNSLLVNGALNQRTSDNDELIMIGGRGARYLEELNLKFKLFPGITDDLKQSEVDAVADYLLDGFRRKFGKIIIVYPKFFALSLQRVEAFQALPYGYSANPGAKVEDRLMEPSWERVIDILTELWLKFILFDFFRSSKQSEFSARIMHLEASTQELHHMQQQISFNYFRQVHALRDTTIREISASKVLLGKRM